MSEFKIINDILEAVDVDAEPVESLPFQTTLYKNIALLIYPTEFDQWAFTVTIANDQVIQWDESEIIEYFLDDETQYFLSQHKITICTNSNSLGLSLAMQPEKIQAFEISGFIRDAQDHLNRFIIEFTAIA